MVGEAVKVCDTLVQMLLLGVVKTTVGSRGVVVLTATEAVEVHPLISVTVTVNVLLPVPAFAVNSKVLAPE